MENFDFGEIPGGFEIRHAGKLLLRHAPGSPFARAGKGEGRFEMYRGNFQVSEVLDEMVELRDVEVKARSAGEVELRFSRDGLYALVARCALEDGRLVLRFKAEGEAALAANRWRFSLPAEAAEHVYGCGEQFSCFDLRGKSFPLWTSEQGVGRNKKTLVTWQADVNDGAGGDYFWTFFPQTSFVSSRHTWCHLETSAYSVFDFTRADRHELYAWDLPSKLVLASGGTMLETVCDVSAYFGRQTELPDWVYQGVILGVQGGTRTCLDKLETARAAGIPVAGIWAQDWEGINMTSFGQRLRWNWVWDRERYPGLDREIRALAQEGVRFLGYINPYVAKGKSLFEEARKSGYLAKDASGGDYLVDFGEFDAGIVDFTDPAAFNWYKGVIRRELLDLGLAGWMADFGEYLPTDAVLHDGTSAQVAHNAWPALWARCNREAVDEAGKGGDILYFMRAGGPGSQKRCPMMWAGDQNVDWSDDDGLLSVIPAALSLAVSGHGLCHSDMGGYTTLYGMKRTKELFMRWAELAAFSPLMRGHEGNRPKDNWQFDSDAQTLAHLAAMGRFHVALAPYLKDAVSRNSREGLPVMRPLFMHFEADALSWSTKDEYLLGDDLLVAPVVREGAVSRAVHLPEGSWVHLWSGLAYEGGDHEVPAALGEPPAFWRHGSAWEAVLKAAVRAARG